jgi:hypothetical protein
MKKILLILLISQVGFAQTQFSNDLSKKQVNAIIASLKPSHPVMIDSSSFATGGKEINYTSGGMTASFSKYSANQFYFRKFHGNFDAVFPVWQKLFDPSADASINSKPRMEQKTWKLIGKSRARFYRLSDSDEWVIDIMN